MKEEKLSLPELNWRALKAKQKHDLIDMGVRLSVEGEDVSLYAPSEDVRERAMECAAKVPASLKELADEAKQNQREEEKPSRILSDEGFDWEPVLANWTSLEGALAIKNHGIPNSERDRARLISRLRKTLPPKDIPVVYEDLIQYSRAFFLAYGPKALQSALKRGGINGCNLVLQVTNAHKRGLIRADEAEALLYAFPCRLKQETNEEAEGASFLEPFG